MTDGITKVAEDSARGSFFLTIGNFGSTVIAAIGVIIVAGLLGPELYGVYTLSFTVPSILVTLVNLGVNEGLIKFSASLSAKDQKEKLARLVRHGIMFNFVVGVFFFLLCYIFADAFATYVIARPQYTDYVRLASFIILLQVLLNTSNSIFIGFNKMEFHALNAITSALSKIVFSIILIIIGLGVFGAITGLVISYLIAALLGISIVFIKIYPSLGKHSANGDFAENIRLLLRYGLPLYGGTIITTLQIQIQSIILAFFASDLEIGFFRAASNFVALIGIVATPITTVLFPAFARIGDAKNHLKTVFSLSVKYVTLALLPIVLLIIALSSEIVSIIYGSAYSSASFYLVLLCIQFLFVGLGSVVFGSFFSGIGDTKTNFKLSLISFCVFLPIAWLTTPIYQVSGLIFSNIASTFITTIYGVFITNKKTGARRNYKDITKMYLAASISLIPLLILKSFLSLSSFIEVFVGGSIYIFVYITSVPFLKILSSEELNSLEYAFRNTRPLALIVKPVFFYERALLTLAEKVALRPRL